MAASYGLRAVDTASLMLAVELWRQGGLVAFPTETVYGLGAHALNPEAVARIFAVKNRPNFDPLIVHIGEKVMAEELAEISEEAKKLMAAFWPGPLTLVLPKKKIVPDIVTAGLPTVALRMPAHPVALFLLRLAAMPIAAPSANPFGQLSPTRAEHVLKYLGDKIELILDGGPCECGLESTIVCFRGSKLEILRPGPITAPQLAEIVNSEVVWGAREEQVFAPGMLKSHYAPRTPLYLVNKITSQDIAANTAALFFKKPNFEPQGFAALRFLSPAGELTVAAANLFTALHELDSVGAEKILAEEVPSVGVGLAIMDRLRKASCQS